MLKIKKASAVFYFIFKTNSMPDISPTSLPGYFQVYINQVPENSLPEAFSNQSAVISQLLPSITEEQSMYAYASGKWTIKELLQHLSDAERIFAYRALSFARNEKGMLPGFEENDYAKESAANLRSWESLCAEFVAVRKSTLFLFDSFTPEMLARKGAANNNVYSVSEIGFILLGHFNHHVKIIRERYLKEL